MSTAMSILLLLLQVLTVTSRATSRHASFRTFGPTSFRSSLPQHASSILSIRGGSTEIQVEEDEDVVDPEEEKRRLALQKWTMDQQLLMQLRSTFLSEALAKRGIPMATIVDVSTLEKPPEKVDWDCAMSTLDDPKPCLYSFDAEPNTKVVAPINTDQWITLSALNRLRRTDPTKVEPMWHSQYAILDSWFGDDSQYSLLQHIGVQGLLLTMLLDASIVLKGLLAVGVLAVGIVFMPLLEYFVNRFLVSGFVWRHWPTWGRIVHAALPLKLLLGQLAWKFLASSFSKLETRVRNYIVDLECNMLEENMPLTVGPGSEVIQDEEDVVIVGEDVDEEDEEEFLDALEEMSEVDDESDW